jgi:hypothetical protein
VLADQLADGGQHPDAGLAGLVVPPEDARRQDAVEPDAGQGGEGLVEVDVAAADLRVLVDADGVARRVGDVAQPVGGGGSMESATCTWVSRSPAWAMIPAASSPWWNVCGRQ